MMVEILDGNNFRLESQEIMDLLENSTHTTHSLLLLFEALLDVIFFENTPRQKVTYLVRRTSCFEILRSTKYLSRADDNPTEWLCGRDH